MVAMSLARPCNARDWQCEINKCFEAVRDNIRYIRDVRGIETIQSPLKTMQFGQGDCDDKAVLLASLLESIGHPTRFVALKFTGHRVYSHVLTETRSGKGWLPMDAIITQPIGWYPPEPSKRMVVNN